MKVEGREWVSLSEQPSKRLRVVVVVVSVVVVVVLICELYPVVQIEVTKKNIYWLEKYFQSLRKRA
jgi:cytochrome c biogenesis factor